jgi:hypothetical protein
VAHQGRSLTWLADKTGYSYEHVRQLASGAYEVTAAFRMRCAFVFDLPEDLLFLPAAERAAGPVPAPLPLRQRHPRPRAATAPRKGRSAGNTPPSPFERMTDDAV